MTKLFFSRFLLILFFCFFTANLVEAEDKRPVVKVGVFQLAPMVYIDDNGSPQGVFVDIIDAICEAEGWKVEYIKGTWNQGLERVKSGEIDLMTAVMHLARRESFLDFPKEATFNIWGQIYVHKDTRVSGVFDMEGKIIGILKGGANGENFVELLSRLGIQGKFVTFDSQEDVAQAIKEKRVYAGVFTNVHGYKYQQSHQLKQTQIVFDPSYLKYATAKGTNQQLLSTIDRYLSKWKNNQNSPYHKIIEKYLGLSEIHETPYWVKLLVIIGVSIISVTLLVVFFLMGFNKKLKKEVKASTQKLVAELDRRKNTEKDLSASEHRLFTHLQNTPIGALSWDLNFKAIEWNPAAEAIFGYSKAEAMGKHATELILPEEQKEMLDGVYRDLISGKGGVRSTNENMTKDGRRIMCDWYNTTLKDADGKVIGAASLVQDITERNRADEALKKSEAFQRKMVANIGDVIVIIDQDFINRYKSPNIEKLFGWKPEDVVGRSTWENIHPDDIKSVQKFLGTLMLEPNAVGKTECRYNCKDGSFKWIEFTGSNLLHDPDIRGLLGNYHDITKRKQSENALEKRIIALTRPLDDPEGIAFEEIFNLDDIQHLQNQFAEATGVASIITHKDGKPITKASNFCRLCNDIIRKTDKGLTNCFKSDAILGQYNPDGPIIKACHSGGLWDAGAAISIGGKHIANWLIGQVRDETQTEEKMRSYAREIGAEEDTVVEAFREVPSMSREQFERVAQILFTLAKQISNTAYQNVQQARFISDLKQSDKEQMRLQSQLNQAQKMEAVGRLAGGVAHDFNNMLSIILGNTEMIIEDTGPNNSFSENLKEIQNAAQRSTNFVRQLLAFARKQTIAPKELNLNNTMEGMLKMLQRLIGEDIELTWFPGTTLWPIKIDPSQIDQVLANLCVNSRDAIKGVGKVTIETKNISFDESYCRDHIGFSPGDYVMMVFSDNGSGMDKDTLENLFEPFFTTKEVGQGTGLGLATIYGIVKQNKGFVNVYSESNQGTTFKIYFPRYMRTTQKTGTKRLGTVAETGSETILLVEDEKAILRMTSLMLERLGYNVVPASTPLEAIRIVEESKLSNIHLLMTDVIMPGMNGRDLSKRILLSYPNIKCLFMSGYTANVIAHHGVLDKNIEFINKPFSRQDLAAKLREIIDAKSN